MLSLIVGHTVATEVKRILQPYPSTSYSTNQSRIDRRPKRLSKVRLAESKFGTPGSKRPGKKPAVSFQKKLVVIEYMGTDAPRQFGLKETYVVMRGMLADISVESDENTVRKHIRDVIRSDDKYSMILSSEFEFLEANGKNIFVPAMPPGFVWSGKAVKNLAGNGAIYVRLLVDIDEEYKSESDDNLPLYHIGGMCMALLFN